MDNRSSFLSLKRPSAGSSAFNGVVDIGQANDKRLSTDSDLNSDFIESKVRSMTFELLSPTLQRLNELDASIQEMNEDISQNANQIMDFKKEHDKLEASVKIFQTETSEWKLKHLEEHGDMTNRIQMIDAEVRREIESSRIQISELGSVLRGSQHVSDDVANVRQALCDMQCTYDARLGESQDKQVKFSELMESRMSACESNLNHFKDDHNNAILDVSRTKTAVRKNTNDLQQINRSFELLRGRAATVDLVQEIQKECHDFIHQSSESASSLQRRLDSLDTSIQSHIDTATKVLGEMTGCQIDSMRVDVQKEVSQLEAKFDKLVLTSSVQRARDMDNKTWISDQLTTIRSEYRQKLKLVDASVNAQKAQLSGLDISVSSLQKHVGEMRAFASKFEKQANNQQLLSLLIETSLLGARMELQDDQDRHKLSLYGSKNQKGSIRQTPRRSSAMTSLPPLDADPTVSVDDRCLSCSSNPSAVLSEFKMACLKWKASPIEYESKLYERTELIQCRIDLLSEAKEALCREASPKGDVMLN